MPSMNPQPLGKGAVDYFLKCKDIAGESRDQTHKDEIEIQCWTWDVMSPRDLATGQASGRYRLGALKVGTFTNQASILLTNALATNTVIKEVKLTCRRTGAGKPGTPQGEYLVITLTNAQVSKVQIGSAPDGDRAPMDEIEFVYERILLDYRPPAGTGSLGAAVAAQLESARNV